MNVKIRISMVVWAIILLLLLLYTFSVPSYQKHVGYKIFSFIFATPFVLYAINRLYHWIIFGNLQSPEQQRLRLEKEQALEIEKREKEKERTRKEKAEQDARVLISGKIRKTLDNNALAEHLRDLRREVFEFEKSSSGNTNEDRWEDPLMLEDWMPKHGDLFSLQILKEYIQYLSEYEDLVHNHRASDWLNSAYRRLENELEATKD